MGSGRSARYHAEKYWRLWVSIFKRSGYFAGHRLRYKNLFCRSLISSCWTLGLGLGFGIGYRRMMDVRVRVRVWIRI